MDIFLGCIYTAHAPHGWSYMTKVLENPEHESTQSQLELIMISGRSKRIETATFYHEAIILNSHKQRFTISTYYIRFCSCLRNWSRNIYYCLIACGVPGRRANKQLLCWDWRKMSKKRFLHSALPRNTLKKFNLHND